ncbi:MAG: class I SAM-dependent methyltransferase [Candidatus Marinimicrobia bacterium]|nr:class I SAM-dependent methyltransferase [Candidatus Neomarinimicrobiota bacterium]|tara:strand:+ start:141 stop:830 length:690 start_codon:yes stop_codon:yes gene_type:complete
MNYGYHADGFNPPLEESDENERYPIHLYHHVAAQIDLTGKTVLEVGSGRGGGASYVTRYLNPMSYVGIDISESAVDLCNKIHHLENLSFQVGDSENIPFKDGRFDVILNVESSHCYGDMDQFMEEVTRVLKPGGHFLWCDLRPINILEKLNTQFAESGMDSIQINNITDNIIIALEKMSDGRRAGIKENVPKFIRKVFESYAGVKGSKMYDSFINGDLIYLCATLKKVN